MKFEWDEDKRKSNFRKHKLDFPRASMVFRDKKRVELIDDRKDYGETRIQVIGKIRKLIFVYSVIVFVVYTNRTGIHRIISARPANKNEKGIYYDNR